MHKKTIGLVVMALVLMAFPAGLFGATDAETLWGDAESKVQAGDLGTARELLTELVDKYPGSAKAPPAHLKLAYIKMRTNPKAEQEIVDAFAKVRAKYPSSPEAGEALASIGFMRSRSDTRQAITDFNDFLSSYPDHPMVGRVQQSLGRLYLRANDLDKAEQAFDRVKAVPGISAKVSHEAAVQSGFVKIMKFFASREEANLLAAIEALDKLTSSPLENVRARANLGIAESLLLLGKNQDARARYQATAEAFPAHAYFNGLALYGVACSSYQMGKFDTALSDVTAFLSSVSGASLTEKDKAWKSVALGSTTAVARVSVEKDGSWEKLPASGIVPKAAYWQAECLYSLRRFDEADKLFRAIVEEFPGDDVNKLAVAGSARCRMARGGQTK